mgnify:CR=1 FL=1
MRNALRSAKNVRDKVYVIERGTENKREEKKCRKKREKYLVGFHTTLVVVLHDDLKVL